MSVIPFAILPSVLPVHGAIISASKSLFGPTGSACLIEWIAGRPQIFSIRSINDAAVPKRVSSLYEISDSIGVIDTPV